MYLTLSPLIRARPQFRLLTPTMYRSRMATTRQTLSMDCGSSSVNLRPAGMTTEDSLELDLAHPILPLQSSYKILSTKIEIKLKKCEGEDQL